MSCVPGLVGFDATPLEVRQRAGVSHYVAHLLESLLARGDGRRYALVASRRLPGPVPEGTLGQVGARLPNRWLWMQLVLPFVLARLRPELCHFTNSFAPLRVPCPYVLTLYDMSLFLHARTQPRKSLLLIRSLIPGLARRASAVLALSESARHDIIRVLRLRPDAVHLVGAAPGPAFRVVERRADLDRVRHRYLLTDPFVLAVGTVEPRKNLGRLIEAFAEARRRGRRESLVLVGPLGWRYRGLLSRVDALQLGSAVRFLGYVPDEDLPVLYNLARAVAFPSLYEGFGLPILEAMACGTPVLTSDRSAMAELGTGAALLVDPTRTEAIADGLIRLLGDAHLRGELREAGLRRAAELSWRAVAERTARVYDAVAASRRV